MARTLSRNGCAVCKARRVKCDEKVPECGPCLKAKRSCPGARTELVFIRAALSRTKRQRQSTSDTPQRTQVETTKGVQVTIPASKSVSPPDLTQPSASRISPIPYSSAAASQLVVHPLRLSIQSSPVTSIQSQLLSFFIEDFGCLHLEPHHMRPWALELPSQMHPPDLEDHFHRSASGAAMAFYGMITADRAMQEEARHTYASSLDAHRKLLLQYPRTIRRKDEMSRTQYRSSLVAITLLLSSFELLLPASFNSWFSHCEGAANLLRDVGPHACSDGFLHQVFQVIRFGCALISLTTCKSSFLGEQQWTEVPFSIHGKTCLDELLETILSQPWAEVSPNSRSKSNRYDVIRQCVARMDGWWSKYENELCQARSFDVPTKQDVLNAGMQRSTAVMVALFNSVKVKLFSLLKHGLTEHDRCEHSHCSALVLIAGAYVSREFNHHARIQVTIPTLIIAMHGASWKQREQAGKLLNDYEASESFGDPVAVHRARQLLTASA